MSESPPFALPAAALALAEGHVWHFTLRLEGLVTRAFVVRARGELAAYVDVCRHQSLSLELGNGAVLLDGLLPCRQHGALYEPATGRCVSGPCEGAALTRLTLEEREGVLWCLGRAGVR